MDQNADRGNMDQHHGRKPVNVKRELESAAVGPKREGEWVAGGHFDKEHER